MVCSHRRWKLKSDGLDHNTASLMDGGHVGVYRTHEPMQCQEGRGGEGIPGVSAALLLWDEHPGISGCCLLVWLLPP